MERAFAILLASVKAGALADMWFAGRPGNG
jgi:hypothetical protein